MLEFIKGLLTGENGTAAQVVSIVAAINVLLGSVAAFLDIIKDKTATQVDNKIAGYLHQGISLIQKGIDFIQGNRAHKKPE